MFFKCQLVFKRESDVAERMRVSFWMRGRSHNSMVDKLAKCGEAPIFSGWELVEWHSRNREWGFDPDDHVCVYSDKRGFRGKFKMSPVWRVVEG